jgi:predicted esterase
MTIERTIETRTHGRYLVSMPSQSGAPLLVGFHGYGENAEDGLRRLQTIPGADRWLLVSVQALNRFYRTRTNEIVASWMTRQNRELVIGDNVAYVSGVLRDVREEWSAGKTLVLAGFSQGVAMAFRAAVSLDPSVTGVIALGGDVPPELSAPALSRIPSALIGRGARDQYYSEATHSQDERRLREAAIDLRIVSLDAAHEWTAEFARVAGEFLQRFA